MNHFHFPVLSLVYLKKKTKVTIQNKQQLFLGQNLKDNLWLRVRVNVLSPIEMDWKTSSIVPKAKKKRMVFSTLS